MEQAPRRRGGVRRLKEISRSIKESDWRVIFLQPFNELQRTILAQLKANKPGEEVKSRPHIYPQIEQINRHFIAEMLPYRVRKREQGYDAPFIVVIVDTPPDLL